jgi:hypothetical protein
MTGGQMPLLDVRGSGSWDSDAQTDRSEPSLEAGTAGGIWLHIACLRKGLRRSSLQFTTA